ncbi:MAG: HAMP domain-containing sensor histidine kinase, partial [Anaerolineaceae bacterium]|nr:HAMP domain-containing sensor histidine kinase [Anaerolineaceae bacterium]
LIERVGPVNDAQRDFIHRVHVNVQNITKLIDDLFNLGQIESGFNSNRESVRLDKMARLALVNFSKRIEEKHQTVQVELSEDFPTVLANPVQMCQMFAKMLDNAVRYTPAGGTITLRSEVDWNQLIFQVSDTGIGIPAADLPFIFDKFYRGSNVPADEGGVGLGMAIVKLIVENHQGRVWVDSAPSRGTTFTVVLPLAVT